MCFPSFLLLRSRKIVFFQVEHGFFLCCYFFSLRLIFAGISFLRSWFFYFEIRCMEMIVMRLIMLAVVHEDWLKCHVAQDCSGKNSFHAIVRQYTKIICRKEDIGIRGVQWKDHNFLSSLISFFISFFIFSNFSSRHWFGFYM